MDLGGRNITLLGFRSNYELYKTYGLSVEKAQAIGS